MRTDIEYADSTVNPTSGCDGCELWVPGAGGPCYAGAIHTRFAGSKAYPGPFEQITLHPGRMAAAARWPDLRGVERPDKPWLSGLPRVIFVGDMADVFSGDVPFEYLAGEVVAAMEVPAGARHFWMMFTKRPGRAAEFCLWFRRTRGRELPANLMLVVSVTDGGSLVRLRQIVSAPHAPSLGVSFEPLVGGAYPNPCLHFGRSGWIEAGMQKYAGIYGPQPKVEWCVVGGESGPKARPMHPEWVRHLRDTCRENGVAFFFKQWGAWWPAYDFCSHRRWVQKALGQVGPGDLCLGDDGRECRIGRDFATAEYPVAVMRRVGKKTAGRELDGRTWDEMPRVVEAVEASR